MAGSVRIEGLRELSRKAKKVDAAIPKRLQQGLKRSIAEVVVPGARGLAATRTNPRWGQQAINTIRALATQQRAQVAVGSNRVPWAAGHNFGSKHTRIKNGRHTTNQFPRTKGYRNGDYALYETIERRQEQIIERVVAELTTLIESDWGA